LTKVYLVPSEAIGIKLQFYDSLNFPTANEEFHKTEKKVN
jgi:hypothetical protein